MTERLTFDANVLVYTADRSSPEKRLIARQIIGQARRDRWTVTLQTLGEFFHVVTRKGMLSREEAAEAVDSLLIALDTARPDASAVRTAVREASAKRLNYWDAVMLATATDAGCTVCFSEDMGDGARLGAIEVVNPFGANGLTERALKLLSPRP